MKVAVCIPSFNEKDNIQRITKIIDSGLSKLEGVIKVIVNCDNNSQDGTNDLFNKTQTMHQKVSLVDSRIGKGVNLLNFFNYCLLNDIDYAMTFDSDLTSIESTWIEKYYNFLKMGYDFIIPKYKRSYQEGNTTNHFIGPVLYRTYGVFIRQPIGGDYGFSKKFIKIILEKNFSQNILMYGIDIFMVVTAIRNNLRMVEVELGVKNHKLSLSRMENIFESVLRGFSEVYKQYPVYEKINKEKIVYDCYKYDNHKLKECETVKRKYEYYSKINKLDSYESILNCWRNLLRIYINNISSPSEELILKMKEIFICRSMSFWLANENNPDWEKKLIDELY